MAYLKPAHGERFLCSAWQPSIDPRATPLRNPPDLLMKFLRLNFDMTFSPATLRILPKTVHFCSTYCDLQDYITDGEEMEQLF
jgi:hypothetical protein